MPELPEVETIKRQLEKLIVGKKITDVEVRFSKKIDIPAQKFIAILKGLKFKSVRRRAKILILDLSNKHSLLIHLKMTGRLLVVRRDVKPTKHTHVILYFGDGKKLFWEDIRKFGYIKVLQTKDLEDFFTNQKFGPEPLEKDFSFKIFKNCLMKSPKKRIKFLLMDQACIAGIGNIYADEGLWYAGVQPTRTVNSLGGNELKNLYLGLREVLAESIKYRGSSSDTYVDVYGERGKFVPKLKAYGMEGESCARGDGGIIKKIRLGGRGTHFCPIHQK